MTHLCYTLEEAAEKLSLSETVLVRLSQSFRVPNHAYEEVGYLSFKGDLTFSDQDIAFFRQVKERLLAGETLEEVKSRIRHNEPPDPVLQAQPTQSVVTSQAGNANKTAQPSSNEPVYAMYHADYESEEPVATELPIGLSRLREAATTTEAVPQPKPATGQPAQTYEATYTAPEAPRPAVPSRKATREPSGYAAYQAEQTYALEPAAPATPPPMVDIEDRTPFEKAAERSFNRYKNMHHPGLGKVFEKMIKEVGTYAEASSKREKFPVLKPMKAHVEESEELFLEDLQPEAQLPFKNKKKQAADTTPPWETVLKQASNQPRALNTNLKTAAMLLRQRALGPEEALDGPAALLRQPLPHHGRRK